MIGLGEHAQFIIWAYAGTAMTLGVLIGVVLSGRRRVERRIARLEALRAQARKAGPP